ncbi:MAG: pyruvate formate-lyase 1-activating enzyme, partial [bacterium]|nr:pyruvate formate-lyase 1-activating enzyme [bacterium]
DMSLKLTNMPINVQNSFIKQCQRLKKKLIIRHVIIPGINDTTEYINNFKNYIKDIKYIKKVELLPYHNMAIDKYKELNISYKLENTLAMDKSVCMELNNLINKND